MKAVGSEIDRLLHAAAAWQEQPLAIATVLQTWGSAPRPIGSHMLLARDGRFEGSVSGGCVEGAVMQAGAEAIDDGKVRRLRFGVADEAAWEVGLPCGGEIEILVQKVGSDGFASGLFAAIADARQVRQPLTVVTDLATGRSGLGRPSEGAFAVRYLPPRRAIIIGAVEIARFLAVTLASLDIAPRVVDPRGRFLTEERFPEVALDDRWPDEAVASLAPDESTAVITLSHDPKIDDPALAAALRAPTGYIAALGSKRSHAKRLERLSAQGFPPHALRRIEGPAGVMIGAIGPAEIAVSIAAGAIKAFRAQPVAGVGTLAA